MSNTIFISFKWQNAMKANLSVKMEGALTSYGAAIEKMIVGTGVMKKIVVKFNSFYCIF